MKKANVKLGQRLLFRQQGNEHMGTVINIDKADVEQVDLGKIEPPLPGRMVVTMRAAQLLDTEGVYVPTLEEVIRAGYSKKGAQRIIADLEAKNVGRD